MHRVVADQDLLDHPDLPVYRDGFAQTHRKIDGYAPDIVGIRQHDGPADGLIEDGGSDPSMQPPRIPLVFRRRPEDRHQLTVLQLIETAFQAEGVFQSAHKTHP